MVKDRRLIRLWWIVCCMMVCLAFVPGRAFAAKVPKLNKTKLTITAGKSYQLKLKNYKKKVRFRSSNSYVAKVSKKGKIKAKHMGYTVIFAQAGDLILQCRVTVRGRKKEKPYIFCYEVDREGKTIVTGSTYNLAVMNGYNQTWKWSVDNTNVGALYVDGNVLTSSVRQGKYCQLIETYMGRPGIVNVTAQSGSKVLHYKMVVNPTAEDTIYTNMRAQVLARIIRPGMSAPEQCLAVAKWLSDYASYVITDGPDYSLLTTHVGQCYHYARTYDFMMDGTAIPCDYISTQTHAWNQVQIDGQWYNIDVTSFDTDRPQYPYNYLFFLVSDSVFWRKDQRHEPYHQCVSTRFDFMKPYGTSPWVTGTWAA